MKDFFLKSLIGISFKTENGDWELNPIFQKGLRIQLRKKSFIISQLIYIIICSGIFLTTYYSYELNQQSRYSNNSTLFWFIIVTQAVLSYFIAASSTATAFTQEKELQTFEALLLTKMTPRDIFNGKFYSSVSPIALLIISSFPILTMSILLGGISPWEILLSFIMIYLVILVNGIIGLAYSLIFSTSGKAKTATYLTILFPLSTYFLPLISLILWAMSYNKLKNYNGIRKRKHKRHIKKPPQVREENLTGI